MAQSKPVLRARSGTAAAQLKVHRPSWSDMYKHYPGESVPAKDFYPMVGKTFVVLNKQNPRDYSNTCAARMSYALNRSGLKLPVAPNGGSLVGDDKLNYWLRVKQLKAKLVGHLGKPDLELKHPMIERIGEKAVLDQRVRATQDFIKEISSKKGIVVFEVIGWEDATGHFTLWDGKDLVYVGEGEHNNPKSWEYYFWLLRTLVTDKVLAQTNRVLFWELK